jgi:hypothetical protein
MAGKRMFSNQIIDTDKFRELGQSAQALYFHLGMDADDDGMVSFKKAERLCGFKIDDLRILQAKNFIIVFESGIVAITHFHINNWLDRRRTKPTVFQNELRELRLTEAKSYMLSNGLAYAKQMLGESRVEENRIEKDSTQKNTEGASSGLAEENALEMEKNREEENQEIKKITEEITNKLNNL